MSFPVDQKKKKWMNKIRRFFFKKKHLFLDDLYVCLKQHEKAATAINWTASWPVRIQLCQELNVCLVPQQWYVYTYICLCVWTSLHHFECTANRKFYLIYVSVMHRLQYHFICQISANIITNRKQLAISHSFWFFFSLFFWDMCLCETRNRFSMLTKIQI